jgi:hypothetical protein
MLYTESGIELDELANQNLIIEMTFMTRGVNPEKEYDEDDVTTVPWNCLYNILESLPFKKCPFLWRLVRLHDRVDIHFLFTVMEHDGNIGLEPDDFRKLLLSSAVVVLGAGNSFIRYCQQCAQACTKENFLYCTQSAHILTIVSSKGHPKAFCIICWEKKFRNSIQITLMILK